MSAAQALTSGLPSSPSGVRSASGGAAGARGDASFGEALDTASRSGNVPERKRGSLSTEPARERKDSHGREGDGRDGTGARAPDGAHPRGDAAAASELSAMLVMLSGTPRLADGDVDGAWTGSGAVGAAKGGDPLDAGPWLPGQVEGGGETLDAEHVRALMTSADPAAEHETVAFKATVVRQETHLALGKVPSGAPAMLPDGDAAGAEPPALQAHAAEDRTLSTRPPGGGAAGEAGPAATALRVGAIAEDWSRSGDPAFADQGIAGQEGRPSPDGRGSSGAGTGSQQQGSGAFLSMLAGGLAQAAGSVGRAGDTDFAHDPVGDQIAAHVRAELKADGLGETSSDGVVKVLELELKPANLGSVTVRIALKDNAVSIHLEAQRLDTLAVIEREREALAGALAAAGYTVDGITAAPQSEMSRSVASLVAPGDSGSSAAQGGLQGQHGQGPGPGHSSGGQGRSGETGPGHPSYRRPSDGKDTNDGGIRRDAGGIYV